MLATTKLADVVAAAAAAAVPVVAADPEPSVKLAALSSLTHLVLGGMVKAKGNVAKVAMLLVDDNQGDYCHHYLITISRIWDIDILWGDGGCDFSLPVQAMLHELISGDCSWHSYAAAAPADNKGPSCAPNAVPCFGVLCHAWVCCAVPCCAELVDRAVLFFESLAASGSGSSRSAGSAAAGASAANPVYNLLPDCLSTMLKKDDPPLLEEQMHVIMAQLLGYVKVRGGK
jgi:hypothetical protein